MTAKEFCLYEIDTVGSQLRKAVEGFSEDQWNQQTEASSMSAKDIFAHLAECCMAAQEHFQGREHGWGTYQIADTSVAGTLAAFEEERSKAVEMFRNSDSADDLRHASSYIVLHEAYHVGQLCAMHVSFDPDWNAYAIYE